jgi:hypothetical protein
MPQAEHWPTGCKGIVDQQVRKYRAWVRVKET